MLFLLLSGIKEVDQQINKLSILIFIMLKPYNIIYLTSLRYYNCSTVADCPAKRILRINDTGAISETFKGVHTHEPLAVTDLPLNESVRANITAKLKDGAKPSTIVRIVNCLFFMRLILCSTKT